jgi:hypothetical protein
MTPYMISKAELVFKYIAAILLWFLAPVSVSESNTAISLISNILYGTYIIITI